MQRPDKIKIGYREYKLEEWKQTVASANEAQGQFFAKEGVIGYTADETGVSHANTLIHEMLHAIIYQWNMDLDEKVEELVVNGLANGLTTIFVDNPKLMDYLKDKIKGAWVAQTIGVTFGAPVEFKYNSTMIQDYQKLEWDENSLINEWAAQI